MPLDTDVECVATALRVHEPSGVVGPVGSASAGLEGRRAGGALVAQVQTPSLAAGHRQRDRAALAHNNKRLQPPPPTGVVAELVDLRRRRANQDHPVPDDEIVGSRRQWWISGGGIHTAIARCRDPGAPCRSAGGEPDRDSDPRSDNGSASRGHSVAIHRRRGPQFPVRRREKLFSFAPGRFGVGSRAARGNSRGTGFGRYHIRRDRTAGPDAIVKEQDTRLFAERRLYLDWAATRTL
jgi:hypothetical protein